jgi:uncharacterized RDD family membrane protein YckC
MTSAQQRRTGGTPGGSYPWHTAGPPVPEAVARTSISGRRAGFVTRALASAADLVVVVLLLAGGYAAVAAARFVLHPVTFQFPSPGAGTLLLLGLCAQALYFGITWTVVGGTYGDRLMGLRVVGTGHRRLHWGRSAVRAALCTLFPIGLLWALVSRENRSVQDLLVRTSVVYD